MKNFKNSLTQWSHPGAILLLVSGLFFRGIIAFFLYPGFDEAYYYSYVLHPNWSYFDHPPLVAITTGLGIWLTGEVTQFTIRLGTLILHTFTLLFLYLTACKIFEKKTALLALFVANFMLVFTAVFGIFNLPDAPLIFFWTLTLYWSAEEFFQQSTPYRPSYRLALIGLMVGLACLGKYHGFLLSIGLLGFCLFNRPYRSALFSPWLGLGLGLFLLAISPIVIWNFQHDWISFRFQSMRAVPGEDFKIGGIFEVWLASVAYLIPPLSLPLWWSIFKAFQQQFLRKQTETIQAVTLKYQFLLWVSLPIIIPFTLLGSYRQVLPGWTLPGYWATTLILGHQISLWQMRSPKLIRRWLQSSALFCITLSFVGLAHITWGTFQTPTRVPWMGSFLPVEADNSTQLFDIQQLRQGFKDSPALNAVLEQSSFIFSNNYFVAGQVAMAIVPLAHKPVTAFDPDPRGFAFWSTADQWLGKDGIYITSQYFQKLDNTNRYEEYFQSFKKIGEVPIYRGGVAVQVFNVYEAKNMLKPYPRPYGI